MRTQISPFPNPNDAIRSIVTGSNSHNLIHLCFFWSSSEVLLIRGIFWGPGNRCWYLSFDGWKRSNRTLVESDRLVWTIPTCCCCGYHFDTVCATCSMCLVLLDRILKAYTQTKKTTNHYISSCVNLKKPSYHYPDVRFAIVEAERECVSNQTNLPHWYGGTLDPLVDNVS